MQMTVLSEEIIYRQNIAMYVSISIKMHIKRQNLAIILAYYASMQYANIYSRFSVQITKNVTY